MDLMRGLFLRLSITICLYFILTLPYISLVFFGFGVDYGRYGCLVACFVTIILAGFIQNKIEKYLDNK